MNGINNMGMMEALHGAGLITILQMCKITMEQTAITRERKEKPSL